MFPTWDMHKLFLDTYFRQKSGSLKINSTAMNKNMDQNFSSYYNALICPNSKQSTF